MNNPWIAGLGILVFFAVGVLISPLWSLLEKEKPKRSYNYSTNEPLEALEFVKRNQKKLFNKGGRVKMSKGGIAEILKL